MNRIRKLLMIATSLLIISTNISSAAIKDIKWKIGANLPEFRKGGCATMMNGKVISVFGMREPWGEMSTMYIYDDKNDIWLRDPNAPVGQCYVQGTKLGKNFYTIGGRGALQPSKVHSACYKLSFKRGQYKWDRIQDLNKSRGWASSVSVGNKLYVLGGAKSGHGPCLRSVEMLDTTKPNARWKIITNVPGQAKGWMATVAINDKIYVFGGLHFFTPKSKNGSNRRYFKDVYEFDTKTNQWTTKTHMPYRSAGADACVYKNRYVIIVGGWSANNDYDKKMKQIDDNNRTPYNAIVLNKYYYCPFVLVYDIRKDQWSRMPSLLPYATNDIRVVIIGKKLYAIGGENKAPSTSNTTCWLRIGKIVEE